MQVYLEFEKPIAEMEGKIAELRAISKDDPEVNILNWRRLRRQHVLREP